MVPLELKLSLSDSAKILRINGGFRQEFHPVFFFMEIVFFHYPQEFSAMTPLAIPILRANDYI